MRVPFAASVLLIFGSIASGTGYSDDSLVTVVVKEPLSSAFGELGNENDQTIELLNLANGESQVFAKSDLQSIQKGVSETTAIDRVGLPTYMSWLVSKKLPKAAIGRVAQIDGPIVYVTIGRDTGIEAGKELNVYRSGTEIKDPVTGQVLGAQRRRLARLQVVEVEERFCKATLIGDLEVQIQIADEVEPTVVSKSVAVLPLVNAAGDETAGTRRLSEELTTGLVNRGVSVVERRLLNDVIQELGMQQGMLFDPTKAQKIGKQIGAYAMIIGTISPKANFVQAQLRLVRVETGEILAAAAQNIREDVGVVAAPDGAFARPTQIPGPTGRNRNLLQGNVFDIWEPIAPVTPLNWQFKNGVLVNTGQGPNLKTKETYRDFELHLEFSLPPACNTGVYLRGRYEVQLIDSLGRTYNGGMLEPNQKCGAIYKLIPPSKLAYVGPQQWNSLDVRLVDRTVTVVLNKQVIINSMVIGRPTGAALDELESEPGPIMLQSHSVTGAMFRNITIKALP